MTPHQQMLDALDYIDPNMTREDWVRIGMAIKSVIGDSGFDVFDQWSQRGDTYDANNIKSTWNSITGNGKTTGATVYGLARDNGWKPAAPQPRNYLQDEAARLKRRQEVAQDRAQSQATVADQCAERWRQAAEAAGNHPYLQTKAVRPLGIRLEGENLLIPMRDSAGKLWSLQTITPDGTKLFATGSRVKGMYHRIKGEGPLVICEGYATGATIFESTGYNVAVAFSCGNLEPVARSIRDKLPDDHIIIAADSAPESTTEKARAVAQAICAVLAIPNVDSDFNDLAEAEGFAAVKAQIDLAGKISKPKANMSWINGFTVTKREVEEMSNPDWVYENLIIQGHMLVIPAPANGGKTTILQYICAQIRDRYSVYYVNADISGGDAKWAFAHAEEHGYTLMLPDMKTGLSMDDVVAQLERMNQTDADYSGIVFIFDTLKKMTDVISKNKAKELYKVLRGLTAKGMTVVLLAHTNKYKDSEGNYIFEGTGDLRTDVDDMIYMFPKKNDDGSMTVSTSPDKVRGTFEPITFEISADREVIALDEFIDVASIKRADEQRENDATVIEAITEAIKDGQYRQTEIIDWCREHHVIGRKTVEKVLSRYRSGQLMLWRRQKALQNNAWLYELIQ